MAELFAHQLTGAKFLAERGFAFLWDEMGTGKTPTAIAACRLVHAKKILVICPAIMRSVWANEFEQWSDYPVSIVEGFVTSPPGEGVTIIGHAALADEAPPSTSKARRRASYSMPHLHAGAPYDVIILDESHQAFLDYNATRAKNFYLPGGGLFAAAKHVWTLTGTPLVNSAADLWLPAYGPLKQPIAWYDWCQKYTVMKPSFDGWKPTGIKQPEQLAEFLRPHVLRRTIDSLGIELPPLTTATVPITLPKAELDAIMQGLDPTDHHRVQRAMENGSELTDAAIARVRHALGLAKVPAVLNHLLSGRTHFPVVIFFQHTDVRERIYQYLSQHYPNLPVSWIDGKITRNQLKAAKEWFQAGKLAVLLVQTQAGGVGLTLTKAHHCLIAELPWTSVARDQAIARLHRITQTQPVTAEIFQVQDCWLESLLANVVARKSLASAALLSILTSSH
jgi:SWI/SNF-related matrix-associated actin-dependent regulator 1 of chromatin subfamily A